MDEETEPLTGEATCLGPTGHGSSPEDFRQGRHVASSRWRPLGPPKGS